MSKPRRPHRPVIGDSRRRKQLQPQRLEQLLYGAPLPDLARKAAKELDGGASAGAMEAMALIEQARERMKESQQSTTKESIGKAHMTVSLYSSTATGKQEIVVQTNAQSLDIFVTGLADALDSAIVSMETNKRAETIASILRNAFPLAFAIAGYKAERVSETRMLVCGASNPGESNLLAQSRI